MTCVELQESLAEIESGGSAEQLAHLKNCPECSALVKELVMIASTAAELRSADEPSPRVWNSIEIALRQEGLIRPQYGRSPLVPAHSAWRWARRFVPVAALLAVAVGLRVHQRLQTRPVTSVPQAAYEAAPVVTIASLNDAGAGLNDEDLLQEVSTQAPALQAQYTENLRRVNESIHDAQGFADANPNDDEARRSLLEAYQQKAMLFELAMDRSLP
ncbi:MAG: anti-sigma factor [Candidatus Sulfotelmatobacter sp.]